MDYSRTESEIHQRKLVKIQRAKVEKMVKEKKKAKLNHATSSQKLRKVATKDSVVKGTIDY